MYRTMLEPIRRATVTAADVHYVGSVTVDVFVDAGNRVAGTGSDPGAALPTLGHTVR